MTEQVRPPAGGRIAATSAGAIAVLTVLQTLSYPEVATALFNSATGHGWDGSGLRWFQIFNVAPGATLFVMITTVVAFRARRSRRSAVWATAALAVLNIAIYVGSIIYYHLSTQAALRP